MEEADTLCTRIGIMAEGELRCIGTQLHLKNKFGRGYRLKLTLGAPPSRKSVDRAAIREFVQDIADGRARVVRDMIPSDTVVTYMIPNEGVKVSKIFRHMEENKARLGIREWS